MAQILIIFQCLRCRPKYLRFKVPEAVTFRRILSVQHWTIHDIREIMKAILECDIIAFTELKISSTVINNQSLFKKPPICVRYHLFVRILRWWIPICSLCLSLGFSGSKELNCAWSSSMGNRLTIHCSGRGKGPTGESPV